MAGRQFNESTIAWLERLITSGASEAQIFGVTAILQRESAAGNSSSLISNYCHDSIQIVQYLFYRKCKYLQKLTPNFVRIYLLLIITYIINGIFSCYYYCSNYWYWY